MEITCLRLRQPSGAPAGDSEQRGARLRCPYDWATRSHSTTWLAVFYHVQFCQLSGEIPHHPTSRLRCEQMGARASLGAARPLSRTSNSAITMDERNLCPIDLSQKVPADSVHRICTAHCRFSALLRFSSAAREGLPRVSRTMRTQTR